MRDDASLRVNGGVHVQGADPRAYLLGRSGAIEHGVARVSAGEAGGVCGIEGAGHQVVALRRAAGQAAEGDDGGSEQGGERAGEDSHGRAPVLVDGYRIRSVFKDSLKARHVYDADCEEIVCLG